MDAESGLYVSVCPQVGPTFFAVDVIDGRRVTIGSVCACTSSVSLCRLRYEFPSTMVAKSKVSGRIEKGIVIGCQSIAEEVGRLTLRPRVIRFKNLLTHQEDTLEVPEEETVGEIRRRYANINGHAAAYGLQSLVRDAFGDWTCRELELSKTLEQNGVPNEASVFEEVDLPSDFCTPVIFAQWMDDLTCQ